MRTLLTIEDIKNVVEIIFNGNLSKTTIDSGSYYNENTEKIKIINQDTKEESFVDLAQYLNINFYTWRNRMVESDNKGYESTPFIDFDTWLYSLNDMMRRTYGLVDFIDESVTSSQDIDFFVKKAQITFLVQVDKIKNLDYYVQKIKGKYLGNPQNILTANGDNLKCYILFGSLVYGDEPLQTQFGECLTATMNVKFSCLANALTYSSLDLSLSLDGTNFYSIPLNKITSQRIVTTKAQPVQTRLDLVGNLATSITGSWVLTFFDFNKQLNTLIDDLFWSLTAFSVDGVETTYESPNIVVWLKLRRFLDDNNINHKDYLYKLVLTNLQKELTNNDYTISSMALKTWGKK